MECMYVWLFAFIITTDLVHGLSLLALDDSLTGTDVDYTGADACIAVFDQDNFHVSS